MEKYDVIVVGTGPAGSAAAKRCTDGGLKTLLIDKKKLPRRKACSGIIANVSQNYVLENFGPIPEDTYGKPYASRGMAFHFPSVGDVFANADCYAPYVWRDKFDHFLAKASNADLQDETRFDKLIQNNGHVEATIKHKKEKIKVKADFLVAADGGRSRVIHSFAPDVYEGLPWIWTCQKYYEGSIDIDDRYLYWFLVKGIGPFPWVNIKDDQIIIGLAQAPGFKFTPLNERFHQYLRKHHGLQVKRELATEGCYANTMTPLNRFFPGRGRVLVVGDAMGLMHQGGEGISCALESGGYAGDAIVNSLKTGENALTKYTKLVKPEMAIALDQFNPFRFRATTASDTSRQPSLFKGFSRGEKATMMKEMISFVKDEFGVISGLMPEVLKNVAYRSVFRKYPIGIVR